MYPGRSTKLYLVVSVDVSVFPGPWTQLAIQTIANDRIHLFSDEITAFHGNVHVVCKA